MRNKTTYLQVLQINTEIIIKKMLNEVKSASGGKIFIAVSLGIMFAATGFVCAKNSGDDNNSPLPDTRPLDISFSFHVDGGMVYYSEDLFISADSCYYKVNDGGAESKTYFKLTAAQLDKLYSVFKDNDFDRIETYKEKVYDRGGENISLRWDKKNTAA